MIEQHTLLQAWKISHVPEIDEIARDIRGQIDLTQCPLPFSDVSYTRVYREL